MTIPVQQTAAALVSAPTTAVVAGISTVQQILDTVKDLFDSGETSVDTILTTIKTDLPGVEQPLLEAIHLAVKQQPQKATG